MPAFGQANTSATTTSLINLVQVLERKGIKTAFTAMSFPDIAELRNMFTTIWMDRTDASHMLMVDADMGFEPELVEDMLGFDKPLVGCLYPKRTYPIDFVGRGVAAGITPNLDSGFMEVEGVGFGVTLIRRDAIHAMLAKGIAKSDDRMATHTAGPMLAKQGVTRLIRAFDTIETETGRLTEDLSFCRRHRDAGGQVWANITHRITHVGPHGYSGRFIDRIVVPKQQAAS